MDDNPVNDSVYTTDNPQSFRWLRVCRIGRAQGLKGEVNVYSYSDEPRMRFAPESVLYSFDNGGENGGRKEFIVEKSRNFKQRWIIKFAGVDDRTAAETLNGIDLYCEERRPTDNSGVDNANNATATQNNDDDDDGFYPSDLIGLDALLANGVVAGVVTNVFNRPGQDLLEITEPEGKISLVPFVKEIVPEINLAEDFLILDPPPGLLEEN